MPACAYATEQITSSLQSGPSCTAEAVHKLTGITVDDFLMVDFGGVVNLSDALGGVNVCVSSNVYDIYSGLKLSKGTHTVEGRFPGTPSATAATTSADDRHPHLLHRHDQQAEVRRTLDDPVDMYNIADTATGAHREPRPGQHRQAAGLADDMNKVPTNRITFATMQNERTTAPTASTPPMSRKPPEPRACSTPSSTTSR
ncbi:hypothetical protein GXW82_29250 [Streptacidiphilus sp. 4-A2]|nr:hypothetical protein [Streptacidiphilus sp. 4-A2]